MAALDLTAERMSSLPDHGQPSRTATVESFSERVLQIYADQCVIFLRMTKNTDDLFSVL